MKKLFFLIIIISTTLLFNSCSSCTQNKLGSFEFSIAIDFSDIKVEQDYLLNDENYVIEASDEFTVKIKAIKDIEIQGNDLVKLKGKKTTHILTLRTEKLRSKQQEVFISLKKTKPQWVKDSNSVDDSNIVGDTLTTFGIEHLISGVRAAYLTAYPEDKYHLTFSVSLKK